MNPVNRDGMSYRRGLVLGLTMAELMLLLVFCLLMALAALIAESQRKLAEAERRIEALTLAAEGTAALPEPLRERVAALRDDTASAVQGGSSAALEDGWTRLVAAAGIVERLRATGVDPQALVSSRDVAADLAIADAVRAESDGLPAEPAAAAAAVRRDLAAGRAAEARVAELEEDVAVLEARRGKRVDLPPIITLREEEGFYFETGSAVLPAAAAARLHEDTARNLADLIARYDVDVIEVIGHTDERRVASTRVSNLDDTLLEAVNGGPIEALAAADNAGLGLARAVAVAQVLRGDRRLAGYEILPLSAAQLVRTDGSLTAGGGGDQRERRRIEIRLRRSGPAAPEAAGRG